MGTLIPLVIASVALAFFGLGALLDDRRARRRRVEELSGVEAEPLVPLLHSINDDRCIGCEACVDVCPTEVLDLVDHKVRVARFSDCVQCEQCANACPTMALVMYREGTTPRMLTVPELDDRFQTGVPGQFLIGEVAGKPLVKNAANLGRAVIEHIARDLGAAPPAGAGVLDVVVVGSGPAGLSAGLTCLRRGLSCVVLEKEHVISSTVSRYPKGKHFMAEPCTSENVSFLPVFDASKEELVAAWERVVAGVKLPIKLGEAVETVKKGDDGVFVVKTTVATYRARTVVLATGLRGKPRLLSAPGANLEKVQSLLDDPAEFAGQHVLVVGGGDSAVEGAMSLADAGAVVTLSYRGDGFKRCKQGNQKRLAEMVSGARLRLLLESNVAEFTADEVKIKTQAGELMTLPNQRAFVLIGADTPVVWLEANNVRFVERPHLYAMGSSEDVVRRVVPDAVACTKDPAEAIATILGQRVHKSAGRRARDLVHHLKDDLHGVVTQVSGAFQLADLEPPPAAHRRDHLPGVSSRQTPPVGTRAVRLDGPTSRPSRPARAGTAAEVAITAASPFGDFAEERTSVEGRPLRPVAKRRDRTEPVPVVQGPAPTALQRELDAAFDWAFEASQSAARPLPVAAGAAADDDFAAEAATQLTDRRYG
ncbi:MAG: NAD(P)-binding domain-containing protein [Kofleriaceae bacterium]|jgi:thioredoxin reductase (NADPH)|nr:NAD(P)-binding domain-containing protein [Kofleriaceae bacterium]